MNKNQLIVTGISGAGKSLTLRLLEDMGYYCVDNLPSALFRDFVRLCGEAAVPVKKTAIVIDSRELAFRGVAIDTQGFGDFATDYSIIYLDARDEVLVRRYNETRRRHPLGVDGDIESGIQQERYIMQHIKDTADIVIDTSKLYPLDLAKRLGDFLDHASGEDFAIRIESFGYKRGVPFEADMVFDLRFSPNPFYNPKFRPLSGYDLPVAEYVLGDEAVIKLIRAVEALLLALIPGYIRQGKRVLTVAFGCTGGRHRSVAVANQMYKLMSSHYATYLTHRDLAIEGTDITARFNLGGGK